MANSVAVRVTAPGAKQAAADVAIFKGQLTGLNAPATALKNQLGAIGTRTSGPLGGVVGGMSGLGTAMVGIGAATAAIGVLEGAGHWLGEGAAAAVEEEAALKRLSQTLDNNVSPGFGALTGKIDKFITQGQALGFVDDDLREGFDALVVRTHDAGRALDLLTLSEDLARGKGMQLADAAGLVGKAYSGQIGALRRAGLAIDANATSTEALAAIQKAYGGQAQAYLTTTQGQIAATNVAMKELQEDLGGALVPAIHAGSTATLGLVTDMRSGLEKISGFFDNFGKAAETAEQRFEDSFASGHAEEAFDRMLSNTTSVAEAWQGDLQKAMESAMEVGVVDTIHDAEKKVNDAMADLTYAIEHPMEGMKEVARIEAELTGEQLAFGLASTNPMIRAQAEKTKQILIDKWEEITGVAYDEGYKTQKSWVSGVNAYDWYKGGWNTAKAWIGGFASKFDAYNWANLINSTIGPYTRGQSPPKKGPLHEIDKWGENVGKAWLGGLEKGMSGGVDVNPPGMAHAAGPALAHSRAFGGGGGTVINIYGLYGGPSGLDELERALAGRRRQTTRGAGWQAGRL